MNNKIFILKKEDYPVFVGLYGSDIPADDIAFGVVTDGKPSALALVYPDEQKVVWRLDWLFVEPSLRKNGIGTFLIYEMANLLDYCGFSDTIATACPDEEIRRFLYGIGFEIAESTDYTQFVTTLGDINTGKAVRKEDAYTVKRIDELGDDEKAEIEKALAEDEGSGFWPVKGEEYLHQSICAYEGDSLCALLLLSKEEDAIGVSYIYAKNGHAAALMGLIKQAEEELSGEYKADTVVKAASVSEYTTEFIKKVFPEAKENKIYLAELDMLEL